ncbi:MAG: serine/threonine-protein kinase, partial [Planctomycetota bacterium]
METSKKVTSSPVTKSIQSPSDLIGVQIGDFLIEKFLAQGGMALVFRGLQVTLKRPVAIKILKVKLSRSQKMIARFNREIEALSTISHPNIVSIFGKGKAKINDSEHYFFAMEYVDGKGLRNAIREGSLDELTTYHLILEILDALDYAHKKGIIHRDIKPENILLTTQNHAKITDFGIAHIENNEEQQLTEENASIGTKAYMAPEQSQDSRSVDARADIYSTGVLLYEMLTGIIPRGVFEPATVVNKKLEFPIDPIIFKAMAHDREKRFASAREMYEKLEEFLQTTYLEQHRTQMQSSLPPLPKKSGRKSFFLFFVLLIVIVTIALKDPRPLLKKYFPQIFVVLNQNSEQNPLKQENTKQPENTTKQPDNTTKQPEDTTKQPEDTTK